MIKEKLTLENKPLKKVLDEIKKPMSLNEIMTKFGAQYPFKVKCVVEFYHEHSNNICHMKGRCFTYIRKSDADSNASLNSEEVMDEIRHGIIGEMGGTSNYSKKFVYMPE